MPDIQLTCRASGQPFTITESDQAFYVKIGVPLPTLCPQERLRRRLAFRNELNLYKRKCDLCRSAIISFFDSEVSFPVYCPKCWWSGAFDPRDYGRDFDFNRPFFEQFAELLAVVPKAATLQLNSENCDYNALIAFSRNTYMSPGSYLVEDCYYVRKSQSCKDCINCNTLDHCELIASSTNCNNCYASHHLINCRGCSNSAFLNDCANCQDCFMCSGLRNKKFYFKNQQYTEENYRKILEPYFREKLCDTVEEFRAFRDSLPQRATVQMNSENCTGDYIYNSQNSHECFDCFDLQDCKYLLECADVKDSMDLCMHDKEIELCYEMCSGGEKNYNTKFSYCTIAAPNSEYLYSCFYLAGGFGCDGFHARAKNCILNKQYTEDKYFEMRNRIIERMKKDGSYGEFFPISISPFAYNESNAQMMMPLTKEQALARGYHWREKAEAQHRPATATLPSFIVDTPDTITKEILACNASPSDALRCGKNYRIIPQELTLYRKLGIPASGKCADCRLAELNSFKNPRHLWQSQCTKCAVQIQTTHNPQLGRTVYCENCYLAWVD